MKDIPLVSIVITYYRKRKYIKKTLSSILNQSYKNYELIFVFDDENKYDLKFINQLLKKFKKKKLIINKKNLGAAKSRNIAVKFCKGSYIAFIDSDDIWFKKKLNKQINFMRKNFCHFTFTSYNIINDKNMIIGKRKVNIDPSYLQLINSNIIGLSTVIINKKLLPKIKFPNLKTQEDFALWLKLLKNGNKLTHIKETFSSWRKTKSSLSSNTFQKIKDAFNLFYRIQNKNLIFSIFSVLVLGYNKLLKITKLN